MERIRMVYFVGAGSGAVDLITVRGKILLEKADVIIYAGSLVNPELLQYAKQGCEIYNSATMNLDEVIQVIKEAEKKEKMTVRLHTGDPSIYGAIREQMDYLRQANIAFEVCPGVSSFLGAAASLQVEYTLPGISQTVIITRMAGRTDVREEEAIRRLAKHQATMAIFLSASMMGEVMEELIQGGYKEDSPAAIVYKATWPDEKIIRCKIKELEQKAQEERITKTALILIGNFLGDDYELSKLYDANFTTGFRRGEG